MQLYAILLCTRTRTGARIVYNSCEAKLKGDDDGKSDVLPSDRIDSQQKATENIETRAREAEASDQKLQPHDTHFGLKTDVLERLLCPGRWSEDKKFELSIDDLTFVGQPCFAHEDGTWKTTGDPPLNHNIKQYEHKHEPLDITARQRDFTHFTGSFGSRISGTSLATSMDSVSTKSGAAADALQMFNLVFVLHRTHPDSRSEVNTDLIYEELCRPLTQALKHLQELNQYVESQCRKISLARSKQKLDPATPIEHEVELAWAVDQVFRCILSQDIAAITLDGIEISVQLPDDASTQPLSATSLNLALILTEDKHRILRSLEGRPEAAPMSYFVTHLISTKPLSKIAARLALPPEAVLFLAEHLIRWRKARLVSPLHARNTYVIHPRAPLSKMRELAKQYEVRFVALPTLHEMLALLGAAVPVVYGTCFPTRAYRDRYMDILEWLVREDIVTRVNTIAWLMLNSASDPGANVEHNDEVAIDDNADTISDSGTAFQPDIQHPTQMRQRLLDPSSVSAAERRELIALRHNLKDQEMQDVFTRLVKYFDGHQSLEDMAVMEGMKRSKVEDCLQELRIRGSLQEYRHI